VLVVPGVPWVDGLTDDEAWRIAGDHLDAGRPFHAHEVFEMRWRQAPEADRAAWQALAQWAAALTHEARGNPVGARRLAQRAIDLLAEAPHVPAAVPVAAVRSSCRDIIGRSD
jgi:hypothetical protein